MLLAGIINLSPLAAFADDVPLPPTTFRASDGGDRYTFTWSKVGRTGANGQAVNPDNVTYILEALNENYETQRTLVSDKILNYTLFYPTTSGEQDIMRFGLCARNGAGKSSYVYTKVVTGAPYNLPYRESFAGAKTHGLCWQDGDATFAVTSEESSDGDFGCLVCIPSLDGKFSSFNLGKIAIEHADNPRLSFRMAGIGDGEKLIVRIARPDGQEATMLTINGPVEDWTKYTIDLSPIGAQKYIIPKFQLAEGNKNMCLIDDISIDDPYSSDLGVLVYPLSTSADNPSVRVLIDNTGLSEAKNAKVTLYMEGVMVSEKELNEAIPVGESIVWDVKLPVKDTEPKEIKAMVEWIYDLNPYNDVASTQFIVVADGESSFNQGSGVQNVSSEPEDENFEVFTLDGKRLSAVTDRSQLLPGIYIINGKKYIVR